MRSGTPEVTSALAREWLERLRPELAGCARAALDNIGQEFPAYISSTMTAPGDFPFRPRHRNPVFSGTHLTPGSYRRACGPRRTS